MKFFSPKFIFFILLISFITQALSDNEKIIKSIKLNEKIKGKMDKDESREYYELKLPKEIPSDNILIFTVKESQKGIKEGEELFSDPDIYVSKKTKYPQNKEESEWYSERYGNDILTIPANEVGKEDIFYICMYCEKKCRYELYSYLSKEASLELGKYYTISVTKKSSMSYALYIPENKDNEELNVIANNPSLKNFRIYMAKQSPSSQNTFQIIPSWTGGYAISVNKYNREYCTDCTYHLLFQTDEEKIDVQFTAYFQSTLTKIRSGNPINDVVKPNSKRCYYFDINNNNNLYNSKLIINTNLFSGSIFLKIYGWKQNFDDKIYRKIKDQPYIYHIENDNTILLQKEDFEKFDKEIYNPENNESKKLYFCTYGQQMSSYITNIYFLSEAQDLQRFNFISPGSEYTGYLQGGQLTRYRILDFNLNKNSIISISFTILEGKVEFFSTHCKEKCKFDDDLLKEKLQQGAISISNEVSFNKKNIIIKPEDNICYKEDNLDHVYKCKTLVIVKCFGNSDDICSFRILPAINDQPIFMSPKKIYYNIIAKGKLDLYEVLINDEEVNSIVVVLNSATGDAELEVESVQDIKGNKRPISKLSTNKDYIPDVVRITPLMLKQKDVIGKYIVKVSASSFSSYNLYYYTTRIKDKDEQPNLKDITLSLNEGNIIKDYFPNDIGYKIFSFTSQNKDNEDIKIVLTRLNVNFSFKVYLDFNKIKYINDIENKYQERLINYDWASDQNNELTIYKTDKKYSKKGPYYIVVTKDDEENEELQTNSIMMYYLGITKRGIPFNLNEGLEHSETLSEKYDYQDYFYLHKDKNNPLTIDVNILNGEVDIFVDIKELTKDNITDIYRYLDKNEINNENENGLRNSLYLRLGINNYASIELYKYYFEQYCIKKESIEIEDKSCPVYIYVVQSKSSIKFHKDSQYIINAKSSINIGTILLSGHVYNAKSKGNNTNHYIIEEVKHKKGASIYVSFTKGEGQIYVRIPKIPEFGANIAFPDKKNYDYIGTDTYKGKIVSIPPKVFERINTNSLKLQMLISILPNKYDGDFSEIEYSIVYGQEPKRISQNVPYQSFINNGEHHYFTFYFDENTENIYISLSNMNGDADMYLKYGNDNLPSINNYHWSSISLGHEYIDININDKFFKQNNKDNISGYYTLLIIGYKETTYTLYISSHPDKIFPLIDNSPVNCQCQIKGEKCYFRYNDVFLENYNNIYNIKKTDIIFTNQYIYGNGKMYATIYKEQELTYDPNKKYQQYFPTEKNFQFSNSNTENRNYLKVTVENQYYSKDSLILLTYICDEKTDVEITSASLHYTPLSSYIDINRENMYYIKYNESLSFQNQKESRLFLYVTIDSPLIYEFHAYTGKSKIKIFTNETIYNERNELESFDYNHISEFYLRAEKDDEYRNIYTKNYINSINNNLIFNKILYFKIKPMSDFGFYLQVTYDRNWTNIPIGETKSYLINKNSMSGYFDIYDNYPNFEMSLFLEEYKQKKATIYVKILVLSKDEKHINSLNIKDKLYHYEIPSNTNYDYKGNTDEFIGGVSLNINNLPIIKENEKNNKFVRALFSIEIKKIKNINRNINISPQSKIKIAVIPGIKNFKRIDLPQNTYYFSNTSLLSNSQSNYIYNINNNNNEFKQYDGNKEVKIYSLIKRSNEDKKIIVHLHSCSGKFDFKLTKKLVDYDNNPNDIPMKNITDEYGRSKYLIDNIKDKNLYLSIKSAQLPEDCNLGKEKDSNDIKCSKELSYLIYYYSLTNQQYSNKTQNLNLKYKFVEGKYNQVKIIIPPLERISGYNNKLEQKEIEYNLIWTKNKTYWNRLDNICYLSQIMNTNDDNILIDKDKDSNENIINILRNIQLNEKNEYILENFDSKEKIYINILARNLRTNELIAYIPLKKIYNYKTSPFLRILISFIFLGLLAIVGIASFNYYKEVYLKDDDDLRIPRESSELGKLSSKKGGYQRISL